MPLPPHDQVIKIITVLTIVMGGLFVTAGFAQSNLPAPGAFTSSELLAKARDAFRQGDFVTAEAYFEAFDRDYGAEPQVADIIEQNKPLIALCKISNGKLPEAVPFIESSIAQPRLPRDILEELTFWLGIHYMQTGEHRIAQEWFGKFYTQKDFSGSKRAEALVMFGTCYVLQGYHRTASEFFEAQIPKLQSSPAGKEFAGRAIVLRLHSLLQAENFDGALRLVKDAYPHMGDISQLVSFQTLSLQLGSKLMEADRFHDAIACLQRIWTRERLLKHQKTRLTDLKLRRDVIGKDPRRQSAVFQLDGMIKRVEREVVNFENIKEFDAALRFRLAMCFQGLERYREAALIMEDMLQAMPPSPIVESASMAVIQCWMQLQRWPRALKTAEDYLQTFGDDPNNKNLPKVFFMQADALAQLQQLDDASFTYGQVVTLFPDSELKPKALFMQGFLNLQMDLNETAVAVFDRFLAEHKGHPQEQDAYYWKGMAFSFAKEYGKTQEHMKAYLAAYENAKYESEATFRIAYCTFCEANYVAAIDEFRSYLEAFGPDEPNADEAKLLLGDALLGEGLADEGIAAYKSINPASTRFFEDGWFKVGKAYKLLEEIETMRAHYEDFLEKYPASQRMPEAVYWIGWTYVAEENLDQAKAVYWETIRAHGDDPELYSISELFDGLPKVYRREGPEAIAILKREIRELQDQARADGKKTLELRAAWAESKLTRRENELLANHQMTRASELIDPEIHNPQIIADCADAALATDSLTIAEKLYTDLRKWHPNSYHKARAYAGLGYIAKAQGKNIEAIAQFEKFEKEAISSIELPDVILAKAEIQVEEGLTGNAKKALEGLLEEKAVSSQNKAKALLGLGDLLVTDKQDSKAVAYYERLYVVYGRYRDLVAKAYLRRGQALERMDQPREAFQVYRELSQREDLRDFPEALTAEKRANVLEPTLPPEAEEEIQPAKEA
ncbi:MAG: tetratricopeptide repeat protein [Verrucomicrobiota bacterium]